MTSVKLQEITSDDLYPFPNLTAVDFSKNELRYLEANLFEHQIKIEEVKIKNNQIVHIDENSLSSRLELKVLKFDGNLCFTGRDMFGAYYERAFIYAKEVEEHCQNPDVKPHDARDLFGNLDLIKEIKNMLDTIIERLKKCSKEA